MKEPIAFLNGEFVALADARIPVLDRGFIFGDGVYEVIPVYSKRLFRLDEHLDRLQNSLDAVRITNPYPESEWKKYHSFRDLYCSTFFSQSSTKNSNSVNKLEIVLNIG